MDAFTDFFPQALVVALLLLAALGAAALLQRAGLPAPAGFLAVGVAAGALGIGPADALGELRLEEIGAIALYAILFQGGIATGFTAWRGCARPIVLLGLPGTAATAAALSVAGHLLLGLDWELAVLVGVALSPTDPAAVYATLRGGAVRPRVRTVLEGESGFNDPVGISLMVVAVAAIGPDGAGVADGAWRLAQELGIGVAGGIAGFGALTLLLRSTPRLEESLQSVATLTGAVAIGAATASLHGSGFLAVYLTGLLASDLWAAQDGRHHAVTEAAAGIAEPVLFGLLGAAFASAVTGEDVLAGLVLAMLAFVVVRPLLVLPCLAGCGFSRSDALVVAVGGLKGAVPLLLAALAGLEALPEATRTEAIVLVATAASIVVQGVALRLVARRAGPEGGREPPARAPAAA